MVDSLDFNSDCQKLTIEGDYDLGFLSSFCCSTFLAWLQGRRIEPPTEEVSLKLLHHVTIANIFW